MTLSATRKADRRKMADTICKIAEKHGAAATLRDSKLCGPREIAIQIEAAGGLRLDLEFDGDSMHPDQHLLSWHLPAKSAQRIDPGFASLVNPSHYQKATDVVYDFYELSRLLERRLSAAADGSAFQPIH